jgi:Protein of unknown function (DUF616)
MKDIAVYTAIAGGYDLLKPANELWRRDADFIAFLERPEARAGWDARPLARPFDDPCRNAKAYKLLPHEHLRNYRYTVWVDGSVAVKSRVPLRTLLDLWMEECDLAVFRHRTRRCIYEEAVACIRAQKDDPSVIEGQVARYRAEGYPENAGLAECTVVVRKNTPEVVRFCDAWWREVCAHSRRDQLSFNYVARRQGFAYREIGGTIAKNPHFQWLYHDGAALPANYR